MVWRIKGEYREAVASFETRHKIVNGSIQLPFANRQSCNLLGRRRFSALTPLAQHMIQARWKSHLGQFQQPPFTHKDFPTFFRFQKHISQHQESVWLGTQNARGKCNSQGMRSSEFPHATYNKAISSAGRGGPLIVTSQGRLWAWSCKISLRYFCVGKFWWLASSHNSWLRLVCCHSIQQFAVNRASFIYWLATASSMHVGVTC